MPITVRRDEFERAFSPPLPDLFQRLWASGRHSVLSPKSVRVYRKDAAARARLTDNDRSPLTFRPTTSFGSSSPTWARPASPSTSPPSSWATKT